MGDKRRNKASGLIAKNWQKYERAILDPVKAGRVQRAETRRAFYAGAQALFGLLLSATSDSPDEVTEADMDLMGGINRELERFVRDVERGKA